jgi:RimJ/RimL family protein N-acetyltransferase
VPAVELMTGRLLLRRPRPEDAAGALMMLQDPEVVLWNPAPAVVDAETARAWCARGADWSDGTHATWQAVSRTCPERRPGADGTSRQRPPYSRRSTGGGTGASNKQRWRPGQSWGCEDSTRDARATRLGHAVQRAA